ncbi:Lipoyltransferase/lipoate-protein ligase [Mycena indigotica]|uniref:Putative lipoate-protein ligase A n=1 Tax=Mycena indigotica TaxID=2126181 RepID=A0A8H6W1M1_9AGAR|nr:Lipoyltransferase/lipoate-protein ligase [Mycena indigotica]KAF7302204.1 Lipoyltransferase/lipoate-protein ligase [Mycena indigotica]
MLRRTLKRCLSTLASKPTHSVYISRSTNPFVNLAFEDWLFRNAPVDSPLLFLYQNAPCVVIGRNQNPWKEVNLETLRFRNVPLVRRRSGGGTVYHDLGNTNFSIHLPRRTFDRKATANIVLQAVRAIGIPSARINDRNDIYVASNKMTTTSLAPHTKSCQRGPIIMGQCYSLRGSICWETCYMWIKYPTMKTAGVASVRAPVTNLQMFNTRAEHNLFTQLVVEQFRRVYELDGGTNTTFITQYVDEEAMVGLDDVRQSVEETQTWEWLYGQTPQFTYTIGENFTWGSVTAEVVAKHARIGSCTLKLTSDSSHPIESQDVLREIEKSAVGQVYGSWPSPPIAGDVGIKRDIETWLVQMLR